MGTPSRGMFGSPTKRPRTRPRTASGTATAPRRAPKMGSVRSMQEQKAIRKLATRRNAELNAMDRAAKLSRQMTVSGLTAHQKSEVRSANAPPLRGSGASRSTGTGDRPMLKGTVVLTGTGKRKKKKKTTKKKTKVSR